MACKGTSSMPLNQPSPICCWRHCKSRLTVKYASSTTEKFSLEYLFEQLKSKRDLYAEVEHRTIFDLDKEVSPLDEPLSLLKFDEGDLKGKRSRPHHSQNRVDILEGQKNWLATRSSWRKKVRALFDEWNISFPNPSSSDVED